MIGYHLLGLLGLAVSALCGWSLYNAWSLGRVRSHGWIRRVEQPGSFWAAVGATAAAGIWFGLLGMVISANWIGLIR